jgi:hypothetical protein
MEFLSSIHENTTLVIAWELTAPLAITSSPRSQPWIRRVRFRSDTWIDNTVCSTP